MCGRVFVGAPRAASVSGSISAGMASHRTVRVFTASGNQRGADLSNANHAVDGDESAFGDTIDLRTIERHPPPTPNGPKYFS